MIQDFDDHHLTFSTFKLPTRMWIDWNRTWTLFTSLLIFLFLQIHYDLMRTRYADLSWRNSWSYKKDVPGTLITFTVKVIFQQIIFFSSYLYCRWCTATYMQQNLCFKMQNSLSSSWNIIADFITRITERIKDHMNWKIKYLGISWLPDILCTFNEIGFWLMAAWPFAFPVFLLPSKK